RPPLPTHVLSLHDALPISDLTDFLRDPAGAHRIARVPIGGQQTLDVIPAFEPVPQAAELLGRDFRTLVDAWSHTYDVIIVDTPRSEEHTSELQSRENLVCR